MKNIVDYEEIDLMNVFRNTEVYYEMEDIERIPDMNHKNYVLHDVYLTDTNRYIFISNFKDLNLLIATFDYQSGCVYGIEQPFDINETYGTERIKRLYRKNISDPKLCSWYEYNLKLSSQLS